MTRRVCNSLGTYSKFQKNCDIKYPGDKQRCPEKNHSEEYRVVAGGQAIPDTLQTLTIERMISDSNQIQEKKQ